MTPSIQYFEYTYKWMIIFLGSSFLSGVPGVAAPWAAPGLTSSLAASFTGTEHSDWKLIVFQF